MADAREHVKLLFLGGNPEDHLLVRTLLSRVPGMRADLRIASDPALGINGRQDAILLDQGGDRSFSRLRALRRAGCPSPILVLTDDTARDVEEQARAAGAADCLPKHRLEPRLFGLAIRRAVEDARGARALRESEERCRALVEHRCELADALPDAIFEASLDGRLLFVNRAGLEHWGYTREDLDRGLNGRDMLAPEHHGAIPAMVERAAAGEQVDLEFTAVRKNGTRFPVMFRVSAMMRDGRPAGLRGIVQDLTERKRAEEALRASEAELTALFSSMTDLVFVFDRQGRFVRIARTRRRDPETLPERLVGRALHDVLPRDEADVILGDIRRALDSAAPLTVERHMTLGGRLTWYSASLSPLTRDSVLMVSREITERRRAEEALAKSEFRFRSLVKNAVFGIYRTTLDGRFIEVNPALVSMLGYASEEELLAVRVADLFRDPAQRRDLVSRLQGVGEIQGLEVEWQRKDGSPLLVSLNGRRVFDDGYGEGFEMIVEDVSERRSLEGQLRQAQKMEAVGRLAGGVAHDFNNLLTAILGYTELLLGRLDETDPCRRDAAEIWKAAERAGGLTRQLLAFSRKQVLQPKPLDLNGVVSSIEPMLRRLIGEDVHLSIKGAAGLSRVTADPGQIEQVIMNLVVNARDAMPDGGRLTIETTNVELDATYARQHASVAPGRYVMLAVSDSGCGMTEEVKSHLFEPFFTTKERGKGTGLGLATVYGIVRQSGGHIWVYSEVGRGTSFKVYFPAAASAQEKRSAADWSPAGTARGSETILLVEDEEAVRTLTAELLARQGYEVLEAPNGEQALRVASTFTGPIHLLLTDVVMPEMSGRDLVKRFAASRPGTRVLYTSGYTDHAVVRNGELQEGIAFLQKPFTPEVLVKTVRQAIEGKAGRR